jgi:hypothetical protein
MTTAGPRPGYQTLNAFARQARDDRSDHDERLGITIDIDAGLGRMDQAFRDLTIVPRDLGQMTDHDGAIVFQLQWLGDSTSVADVDLDFYALLGHFAEGTQFVHRTVTDTGIVYDAVIGSVSPPHTHRLRFQLQGQEIQRVAREHHRIGTRPRKNTDDAT